MNIQLDELDRKILKSLSDNARKPFLEIARECGVSGAAVHQRVNKLISQGIIKGFETILSPDLIGYSTCAFVGIYLKSPNSFQDIVNKLCEIPEVVECHFTSGSYDIFIKIYARNNKHLLEIIHTKLQHLEVARTETIIAFREQFHHTLPLPAETD